MIVRMGLPVMLGIAIAIGPGCSSSGSETSPDWLPEAGVPEAQAPEDLDASRDDLADTMASDEDANSPSVPVPSLPAPDAPPVGQSPEQLGYRIEGAKRHYVIGNKLTPDARSFSVRVTAPATVRSIDVWLDQSYAVQVSSDKAVFEVNVEVTKAGPGKHEVLLAATGEKTAFARLSFLRTHPYYVFVSNDWDVSDQTAQQIQAQETLHEKHPDAPITHFVGPYTFTDPTVSVARRKELVTWLKGLEAKYRDEIGLHIHPYCNFVEAAGIRCRNTPTFDSSGATSGYTVLLSAYTEEEMRVLLKTADSLFAANGLEKPRTFRAGGWSAEIHTLRALADNGFVMDASGANWKWLSSWKGVPGAQLYEWCQEHWNPINDTSQPYYPSQTDMLVSKGPTLSILEVPDNGVLADYVTGQNMIDIFNANWSGEALDSPRVLSIGYHPVSFVRSNSAYAKRLEIALTEIDKFQLKTDKGPVIYVRGSEIPVALPPTN